ncbi:DNA polymerase IV [Parvularcula marina]|nr:DNA polymerase IV [Parvularcula marina]
MMPERSEKQLCRDCGNTAPMEELCPNCGSARTVRHPELFSLGIAHVDCDAFFAAIEKRDRPELANKPVLVGGEVRGVVAACCYIARSYGIRSAMPMFKAKQLCPEAVVVRSSFDRYKEAAHQIREEMRALTPLVEPASIDEAYMDMTGTDRLHGAPPAATLARFARRIEERVGITVSIGLSHNKLLAKIASDFDKPRGFFVIGREETAAFLAPHPVSLIPGVGQAFAARLSRDGFRTLGDVQKADDAWLEKKYGDHGRSLARRARGEDRREVVTSHETKSVSGETTFNEDLSDREPLEDRLYAMAKKVSTRAKAAQLAGRVVTLKLKTHDFKSFTRRRTLPHATNLTALIFETGRELLAEELIEAPRRKYRLIGVGISDLVDADLMDDGFLFSGDHKRIGRRENAVSSLAEKFGDGVIGTLRDYRTTRKKKD